MREIKFRAKRLDNGQWVSGSGLLVADDFCVIDTDTEMYVDEKYEWAGNTHFFRVAGVMCDLETIGQYTGFKDMNDKEIYEGDIIRDFHWFYFSGDFTKKIRGAYAVTQDKDEPIPVVSYCRNYAVEWGKRGSYILRNGSDQHPLCTRCRGVEVIGNIYDNPDLLKK